jgi:hypothetical protein
MEFILGMAGAFLCVALLVSGVALGWYLAGKYSRRVTAETLTETEKRRLKDEHEAFNRLQNYSVEDAYRMYPVSKE